MSFGSSTSPRFKVARNHNPAPGKYHKEKSRNKALPGPPSAATSRSQWLHGKMEVEQHMGLSREGFVGSQKCLESPGPGSYNARSTFDTRPIPSRETGFLTSSKRFTGAQPGGETPYRGHETWRAGQRRSTGAPGFNQSNNGARGSWLHGDVVDQYATRPAGYQSRQHVPDTPGPGSYESRVQSAPAPKLGTQQRFQAGITNPQVGPGSYQVGARPAKYEPTPAATQVNRSNWLHGAVGGPQVVSGSQVQHVSRERMADSPGPGNYNQRSSFERAIKAPIHQISLEERFARGI